MSRYTINNSKSSAQAILKIVLVFSFNVKSPWYFIQVYKIELVIRSCKKQLLWDFYLR